MAPRNRRRVSGSIGIFVKRSWPGGTKESQQPCFQRLMRFHIRIDRGQKTPLDKSTLPHNPTASFRQLRKTLSFNELGVFLKASAEHPRKLLYLQYGRGPTVSVGCPPLAFGAPRCPRIHRRAQLVRPLARCVAVSGDGGHQGPGKKRNTFAHTLATVARWRARRRGGVWVWPVRTVAGGGGQGSCSSSPMCLRPMIGIDEALPVAATTANRRPFVLPATRQGSSLVVSRSATGVPSVRGAPRAATPVEPRSKLYGRQPPT